jgi:hypothetical protein
MSERKTLLSFLQSWPVRDVEADLPRRYDPACDLLRDPRCRERIDRAMVAETWSAAFAALLLHGFLLEGPQAERAIERFTLDQFYLGDELPELASIVRLHKALASDRRTLRQGKHCSLKPKVVFEIAESTGTSGATLVQGLFIHRYEALTLLVGKQATRIGDLELELQALRESRERVSPKQVNALKSLLYLVARRQSLRPKSAISQPENKSDEALANWLHTESLAALEGTTIRPPAQFEAIKNYVGSGRNFLGFRKPSSSQGE